MARTARSWHRWDFSLRHLQQPASLISPGERVRLRIAELILSPP